MNSQPSPIRLAACISISCLTLQGCGSSHNAIPNGAVIASEFPMADFAEKCEKWDDWDKPAPPFRVHGGTYHVGTCGITAILITGSDGHLLIDNGTAKGGEVVAANIEALGFSLKDVRYLAHTQEHFDHVGSTAYLKSRTGAKLIASERAKSVFETGIVNTDDPQYGMHDPMARVSVDRLIENGQAIQLDGKRIVAQFTPGHSPGAISWRWDECEENACHTLVFTDGMGPVSADSYVWTDHPDYLSDYRASVAWLETVKADICLSAHPSQVRLIERIESGSLVDPGACTRAADSIRERLNSAIEDQTTIQ